MEEGCYMASIDIKDAYFSFAINSHDQNFMFSMGRSTSSIHLFSKWTLFSLRSRRYSWARENGKLEIPPAQKRHILSSAHCMVPPILMYFIYFNYLSNSRIYTSSLGPVYEFVCDSFRTGNLNCFRVK
jgi:hypothetical protein